MPSGTTIQPTRQPVMEKILETRLIHIDLVGRDLQRADGRGPPHSRPWSSRSEINAAVAHSRDQGARAAAVRHLCRLDCCGLATICTYDAASEGVRLQGV